MIWEKNNLIQSYISSFMCSTQITALSVLQTLYNFLTPVTTDCKCVGDTASSPLNECKRRIQDEK